MITAYVWVSCMLCAYTYKSDLYCCYKSDYYFMNKLEKERWWGWEVNIQTGISNQWRQTILESVQEWEEFPLFLTMKWHHQPYSRPLLLFEKSWFRQGHGHGKQKFKTQNLKLENSGHPLHPIQQSTQLWTENITDQQFILPSSQGVQGWWGGRKSFILVIEIKKTT